MHSCRRRQSPHWAGIRTTAVGWNHQQPAFWEAPWMARLGSLEPACPTCQALWCPQRHHEVCVITEWGKTPCTWDLSHVLYSLTCWSCCRQRLLLFILLKEKRLKKGAAQDLSLHMLLAPSSVFVLEMQAEILKCSFALTAPTHIFNESMEVMQIQQILSLWLCYLMGDLVVCYHQEVTGICDQTSNSL